MGIVEVIARLATIRKAFAKAVDALSAGVDRAILIDSASFNLRLAEDAGRAGVPVTYFIAPKIWASRAGRMQKIRRVVDQMMVILPFEEALFRDAGVPVTYVGNPLVDEQAEASSRAPQGGWRPSTFGLDDNRPTVALLPGSRPGEIRHILPGLLETARELVRRMPETQFLLPVAPTVDGPPLRDAVAKAGVPITVVEGDAVPVLMAVDAAAVASGTATLQAALAGTPSVIVYRVNALTWMIARPMVKLPHVGLSNLVAGREVMPELLQNDFRSGDVAERLHRWLTEAQTAQSARAGLAEVQKIMGDPGAPERAAQAVLKRLEAA